VTLVIAVVMMAAMSVAAGHLETNLRETARITAVAVADRIEQEPAGTADDVLPQLRDLLNAAADLRSISVFRQSDAGAALFVSTSAAPTVGAEDVQQTIARGTETWVELTPQIHAAIVPVRPDGRVNGAVAVTFSLLAVRQVVQTAGWMATSAAALAVLGITVLIHVLVSRLVLNPVERLHHAMARARVGDLQVRVPEHPGELGDLGEGLNQTLAELEDLHQSLSERVARATQELRERNEQLVRSYESVLQMREATARLQQLAAVGQTMAVVAHQIGTPLSLASGHLQLLSTEVMDPALAGRVAVVAEQLARVSATVQDLLQRSRPRPEERSVDIRALVQRIAEANRPRLAAADVHLAVRADEDLPPVLADETQLELALLNLITNALDAMPSGGQLKLSARDTPAGVVIEVSDTGTGIASDLLPRIFDPWVSTKPQGQGTGLGLSITRDVITALNGRIHVTSMPGNGATFTIDLPVTRPRSDGS